jgi:hypothetical protein
VRLVRHTTAGPTTIAGRALAGSASWSASFVLQQKILARKTCQADGLSPLVVFDCSSGVSAPRGRRTMIALLTTTYRSHFRTVNVQFC